MCIKLFPNFLPIDYPPHSALPLVPFIPFYFTGYTFFKKKKNLGSACEGICDICVWKGSLVEMGLMTLAGLEFAVLKDDLASDS